ncbi:MAG: Coenzyme F420 hydrogenase/dehydrogenase, beta subunit C-terminal domain [Verrucomicrobiales bacterium]|nr:Coenzyme F420 hydrogenase/dehydrogenase, beta subunit C-terminal domain [Verrucomicrobiales bacterium]
MAIRTSKGIVDWRLCLGCGACAYICPERKISLWNFPKEGIRPSVTNENCGTCRECVDVCPAVALDHRPLLTHPDQVAGAASSFGPVLEIWEGHATDPEIRLKGSSGGILTALGLFCVEREGMHGVVHIGSDPERPLRNRTRLSRSRAELIGCAGSRYAPASACDGLSIIEQAPAPCVFIGQPSEVAAARKAEALRPNLKARMGLTLSFFCAGSPSTQGTEDYLRKRGYEPSEVEELRYRGHGWPGMFGVRRRGRTDFEPITTYQESWGYLQRYRPFAVHLTPDFSGENADISSGDPWYRPVGSDEIGLSILVVRTERGREIVRRAVAAGYLTLKPASAEQLVASQVNLIRRRGSIWGRVTALRMLGIPAPKLEGFALGTNWLGLPIGEKMKSLFGTARRAMQRGYRRPQHLNPAKDGEPIPSPLGASDTPAPARSS